MKWVSMLLLTFVFASCAHQDRSVSSLDESAEEKIERRTFVEPHGARYYLFLFPIWDLGNFVTDANK